MVKTVSAQVVDKMSAHIELSFGGSAARLAVVALLNHRSTATRGVSRVLPCVRAAKMALDSIGSRKSQENASDRTTEQTAIVQHLYDRILS